MGCDRGDLREPETMERAALYFDGSLEQVIACVDTAVVPLTTLRAWSTPRDDESSARAVHTQAGHFRIIHEGREKARPLEEARSTGRPAWIASLRIHIPPPLGLAAVGK